MTNKQIKEKCKEILNSYAIGAEIDTFSNDYTFLIDVFRKHSEWEEKSKDGVQLITIFLAKPYNTRCFKIVGYTGYETDISYIHAVDGSKSKLSDVKSSMRSAVRSEIEKFKSTLDFSNLYCPISKEKLHSKNTHIDHYDFTFDELSTIFISNYGVENLFSLVNKEHVANETEVRFLDKELIKEFIDFHNKNTNLRAVSINANLSILRKGNKRGR